MAGLCVSYPKIEDSKCKLAKTAMHAAMKKMQHAFRIARRRKIVTSLFKTIV